MLLPVAMPTKTTVATRFRGLLSTFHICGVVNVIDHLYNVILVKLVTSTQEEPWHDRWPRGEAEWMVVHRDRSSVTYLTAMKATL